MTASDRILTGWHRAEDIDAAMRPHALDEFVGQRVARDSQLMSVEAAK